MISIIINKRVIGIFLVVGCLVEAEIRNIIGQEKCSCKEGVIFLKHN